MTRIFKEDGRVIPITVVKCEPNEVAQVKTTEKDGYPAVVLGFSKLKRPTKTKKFYHMKEFKVGSEEEYKIGDQVTLESFQDLEKVSKITAVSKGKGFQGVIKRHNFGRGPETHGSHHHREPGSIGACAKPGRVDKGKKMPGHMGHASVTTQQVGIAYIDPVENLIGFSGTIPGPSGGLVIIQK